ncbi:MAG: transketolase C-terminal domain-containing protein [Candidatus Gracilibacteria bacterium]|jgi:transketolase|nr:transketolase C-terminal domain-containing protein [Candidatus Gracilibacteria bacterium]
MIGGNYNIGAFLNSLSKKTKNFAVFNSLLKKELCLEEFMKTNEDRYFDFGNGISSMFSVASGFSARGKTPILFGYSDLIISRAYDQIRNDFCLNNMNVRIVGVGSGFDNGLRGGAHQFFEEVGILSGLFNMKIYSPSSLSGLYGLLERSMGDFGPVYFRLPLSLPDELVLEPVVFDRDFSNEIVIITYGKMVEVAKEVVTLFKEDGVSISLLSVDEVFPFNYRKFQPLLFAKNVFLIEDQNRNGLFSEISRSLVLSGEKASIHFLGIQGRFSESGKPLNLMKKYELDFLSLYGKIKEKLV